MKTILKILFVIPSVFLLHSCTKDNPKIPVPVISTKAATSITLSSAVSGGEMREVSTSITAKGVCWSTIQNPTISDIKATDNSINKSFSINMSSLSANTVYYVRAFATNSTGTGYGDQISFTTLTDYSGQTDSVIDVDGNTYPTIGIGSQIWMARNLAASKFQDGTPIPQVTDSYLWTRTTLCYCYYDNETRYKDSYGALYNWYTIDKATTGKNICPVGWHVPSREEFLTLIDFLGPEAAKKLNESGTSHWWLENPATNESGFTALPGGIRESSNGVFLFLGDEGYLWTSTSSYGSDSYRMSIHRTYVTVTYLGRKADAYSIRCLKD